MVKTTNRCEVIFILDLSAPLIRKRGEPDQSTTLGFVIITKQIGLRVQGQIRYILTTGDTIDFTFGLGPWQEGLFYYAILGKPG